MIAFINCDNFYVSCERIFNPLLMCKPVVILSPDKKSVLSCSQEAKDLGIKVGVPLYQIYALLEPLQIKVLSSNYTLYDDLAKRVMMLLRQFSQKLEFYSLSKFFLDFSHLPREVLLDYGAGIQKTIKECLGFSLSFGLGPNKILARLAQQYAMTFSPLKGTTQLLKQTELEDFLNKLSIEKVGKINKASAKLLYAKGIFTALQLQQSRFTPAYPSLPPKLQEIVCQLQGEARTLSIVEEEEDNSLTCCTHSFPKGDAIELQEAAGYLASQCGEKLRKNQLFAHALRIVLYSKSSSVCRSLVLPLLSKAQEPSHLTYKILQGLNKLAKKGQSYAKVKVTLLDLSARKSKELNSAEGPLSNDILRNYLEQYAKKIGADNFRFFLSGLKNSWLSIPPSLSKRYTTHWEELLTVK